jgi:transposase
LVSRRVLWVGEGKKGKTLREFFADFGVERTRKLEIVAMDMGEAYRSVVEELAPQADIVFDRFHVVKLLLEAIDEVRREEVRKLSNAEAKKALKGTRFSLLRNPRNWTPRDEETIRRISKINRRLFRASELRIEMEAFWDMEDEASAREFIMKWTRSALLSRLEPIRKFARTVRDHLEGILGFFRHGGVTSGSIEGINNKIKLIIHRAFGMSRVASLISMIHLCCSGISL